MRSCYNGGVQSNTFRGCWVLKEGFLFVNKMIWLLDVNGKDVDRQNLPRYQGDSIMTLSTTTVSTIFSTFFYALGSLLLNKPRYYYYLLLLGSIIEAANSVSERHSWENPALSRRCTCQAAYSQRRVDASLRQPPHSRWRRGKGLFTLFFIHL